MLRDCFESDLVVEGDSHIMKKARMAIGHVKSIGVKHYMKGAYQVKVKTGNVEHLIDARRGCNLRCVRWPRTPSICDVAILESIHRVTVAIRQNTIVLVTRQSGCRG
jgi:hypothetical protein